MLIGRASGQPPVPTSPATTPAATTASPATNPTPAPTTPAVVPPSAPVPGAAAPNGELQSLPRKIQYLKTNRDELVPILWDARLEEFLEWLEQRQGPVEARRPEVSVSAVELNGTADDQYATLGATIRVQVVNATQSLLFSLGLPEAILLDADVTGPSPAVYGGKEPDTGYRWWLTANGLYEFRLQLLVPLRRVSPWRRLQLTMPSAPVSSLQLTIPETAPVVKGPEDVVIETRPSDAGRAQVTAGGFGGRLDLQWQATAPVVDQPATLDVNTTLLVRGSSTGFTVDATQYVKALQGVFKDFTVRLPEQAELLQVEGGEIRQTQPDAADPTLVRVELNNATAGPVTVKWSVRIPPATSKRTLLSGFSVNGARRQSGEIGLLAPEGARWTISEADTPKLDRMNAGELRTTVGGSNIVRAYRFYNQPFSLPLVLQGVDPFFDARSQLILHASRDELRLEGRYDIRTFRGPVRELVLQWPGWRTEGWKLEGIQPAGTVVTGITTDDTTDNGRLLVAIADQAPANFELRVMARCPRPKTAEARLALPRLLGPTTWATRVLFLHAENIDAELLPMGETALRPIETDGGTTAESLGFDAALAVRHYRLDTEERLIAIQVTPRTQRVSVASSTVAEIRGRRLRVEQSLRHRVEYERLGELHLQVPTGLAAGVAFRLGTTTLTPTWSDGDRPRERIAKLKLPQALLGEVTIVATWEQPLPDELWIDRDATIAIPLLTSRSGTFTTNELTMTPPAWFTVSAVDAGWQRGGGDRALVWSAGGEVTTFDGLLSPGTGAEGEPFLASRALVALSADPQGQQTYVVAVRVSGSGAHLNVQLPATATPGRFSWDGRLLDESEILEFPLGSRRYTLPWSEPQTADQERLLRIEYAVPGTGLTGLSSLLATQVPKIPQCRWTDRVVWWIDVPASQHLFGPPLNVTPLYAWTRSGFVWRREPLVTRAAMTEWLAGASATGESTTTAAWPRLGNDYAFTQFGPLEDVRLRLMSSAMGFLLGAGGALGLGFLLIKVRVFRSLISLLGLCCGAMVSALWFLPQMELLFQPMLVGGGLAALLGWHEAWSRRRSAGALLNLSVSPGDWQTATVPDPSAPPASLLLRGTDSATIYREPTSDDTRSRHPMESHVG